MDTHEVNRLRATEDDSGQNLQQFVNQFTWDPMPPNDRTARPGKFLDLFRVDITGEAALRSVLVQTEFVRCR